MKIRLKIIFLMTVIFGCTTNTEHKLTDSIKVDLVKDSVYNKNQMFICENFNSIDSFIISNDQEINKISNLDSLSDLAQIYYNICDTSLNFKNLNKINQIIKNKNIDGYVGEYLSEIIYDQFEKCPCLFYNSMNFYYKNDSFLYSSYKNYLYFNLSNRYEKDSCINILNDNIKYDLNGFITKDMIKDIMK